MHLYYTWLTLYNQPWIAASYCLFDFIKNTREQVQLYTLKKKKFTLKNYILTKNNCLMICYLGFSRICETTCLELNDKLVNRIISIFSLQLHFSNVIYKTKLFGQKSFVLWWKQILWRKVKKKILMWASQQLCPIYKIIKLIT